MITVVVTILCLSLVITIHDILELVSDVRTLRARIDALERVKDLSHHTDASGDFSAYVARKNAEEVAASFHAQWLQRSIGQTAFKKH